MLIGTAARAASCQFTVNYDSRDAAHAILLCFGRYFRLLHVVDDYLMGRTSKVLNYVDRFLAR